MRTPMRSRLSPLAALVLVMCAIQVGCTQRQSPNLLTCRVLVDGIPALEVHLVLLRSDQGELQPVLAGIADASGNIPLKLVEGAELPSDKELELIATIESVGSSEWQLNKPWSDPKTTPLKVKWPTGAEQLDIQLPKKAIRSI